MARLVIGGTNEKGIIAFEDAEIQEIIALFDEGDRFAVEQELEKRANKEREKIHIHVWELDPFRASAIIGNVSTDWWLEII